MLRLVTRRTSVIPSLVPRLRPTPPPPLVFCPLLVSRTIYTEFYLGTDLVRKRIDGLMRRVDYERKLKEKMERNFYQSGLLKISVKAFDRKILLAKTARDLDLDRRIIVAKLMDPLRIPEPKDISRSILLHFQMCHILKLPEQASNSWKESVIFKIAVAEKKISRAFFDLLFETEKYEEAILAALSCYKLGSKEALDISIQLLGKINHDSGLHSSRPYRAILLLKEYSKLDKLLDFDTTSTFFEDGVRLSCFIENNQLKDAVNYLENEVVHWAQKGVKRTVLKSLIETLGRDVKDSGDGKLIHKFEHNYELMRKSGNVKFISETLEDIILEPIDGNSGVVSKPSLSGRLYTDDLKGISRTRKKIISLKRSLKTEAEYKENLKSSLGLSGFVGKDLEELLLLSRGVEDVQFAMKILEKEFKIQVESGRFKEIDLSIRTDDIYESFLVFLHMCEYHNLPLLAKKLWTNSDARTLVKILKPRMAITTYFDLLFGNEMNSEIFDEYRCYFEFYSQFDETNVITGLALYKEGTRDSMKKMELLLPLDNMPGSRASQAASLLAFNLQDYSTAEKLIKNAFSKTGKRSIFFISMYIHVLMATNRVDQAVDLFTQEHGWPSKNLKDKKLIPLDTFMVLIY